MPLLVFLPAFPRAQNFLGASALAYKNKPLGLSAAFSSSAAKFTARWRFARIRALPRACKSTERNDVLGQKTPTAHRERTFIAV